MFGVVKIKIKMSVKNRRFLKIHIKWLLIKSNADINPAII